MNFQENIHPWNIYKYLLSVVGSILSIELNWATCRRYKKPIERGQIYPIY